MVFTAPMACAASVSSSRWGITFCLCGTVTLAPWKPRPYPHNWELRALLPALDWLREESPPAGDAEDFAARPAGSVMAFWHYGHWLTYVAQRANVACPFGNTAQHQRGLDRSQAFFGARTEADAVALCTQLGVRYVLSPDLPLPLVVAQAGLDPRKLHEQEAMATSLHLWRGLRAPRRAGPLRRFRLVAEFAGTWPGGRPYATRVFEFVPGARLVVGAPPGGTVTFRVRLADEDGRTIDYVASARPNEAGVVELRVPYATEGSASRFRAAGPARVLWSDGSAERGARVTIPESAVQTGAVVGCNLL